MPNPYAHPGWPAVALSLLSLVMPGSNAQAQITPDASLGSEASTINTTTVNGSPAELIEAGAQRGGSLFHSFSDFNVLDGQQVYFANPGGVDRIFSRVTGANPSEILGTLGVLGAADLFLLNPNGVVFGPNAALDLSGSLVVSSADSVLFENNLRFSASNPQAPPLLTIGVPLGLQMGAQPGPLINTSFGGLAVPGQKTLAFVGGEVVLDNSLLLAPGGRVELAGLGENAVLGLEATGSNYALAAVSDQSLRPVRLINGAVVEITGEGASNLQIQGSRISITEGAALLAFNVGDIDGGQVVLTAPENILLSGTLPNGLAGGILLRPFGGTGAGLDLTINTGTLTIESGAIISASTFGAGQAGDVTINATEAVNVIGTLGSGVFPSGIFASSQATGDGGNIAINTAQLRVLQGAYIGVDNQSQGASGNVVIDAAEFVEIEGAIATPQFPTGESWSSISAFTVGETAAGQISLTTGRLSLTNGGQIVAGTVGDGESGNIFIEATDLIEIAGISPGRTATSVISSQTQGRGNAGNIALSTPRLLLQRDGQINNDTIGQGNGGTIDINAIDIEIDGRQSSGQGFSTAISAETRAADGGNGGQLLLRGNRLVVRDGGVISATTQGTGNSGNLDLQIQDSIVVMGRNAAEQLSRIESQVTQPAAGNGGNVVIETGRLTVQDDGQIVASTLGAGDAGSVIIRARDWIEVQGHGSTAIAPASGGSPTGRGTFTAIAVDSSSSATGNAGSLDLVAPSLTVRDGAGLFVGSANTTAGDLRISARVLALLNGGRLSAETLGIAGGNIALNDLALLVLRNGSSISARAGNAANGGNIAINAPNGFVVAVSVENSDILASAELGNGGNIGITAQGVFGLVVNSSPDRLAISEINASSEAGIAGTVAISNPDVTLQPGTTLPADFSPPPLAQGCGVSASASRFTNVGRGGVPTNPTDPLTPNALWHDFLDLEGQAEAPAAIAQPQPTSAATNPSDRDSNTSTAASPLREAQGWQRDANGTVYLVAQGTGTPARLGSVACAPTP
ncbi:filamentous hemagglutinin N-terminal domain-containing protein [Leptolyngbya sp. CCNP1308]|uniref:two-partner secretion domain-containing protein n=1 Tax=Leptolyngbya sp. CCNP1308 TaxID=3110255 RepID=UPI002B216730|nr:filamentous hemagglutinin N-terminal domain-containing protein [Leptolyngbya sp. CCNP1308]MEA5449221.1 filamentous hemagglutinin N-terminal domain-containing protein [Leptolyngbya sp. CCNP1308]